MEKTKQIPGWFWHPTKGPIPCAYIGHYIGDNAKLKGHIFVIYNKDVTFAISPEKFIAYKD